LYVLNAVTPRPNEAPSGVKSQVVSVGINAVTIPEYLDRSEIVVRSSVNELKARESERWGEPLAAGATRAVTENLAHALPGDVIVAVPTRSKISLDYEINLDLTEFEIDEDGRAVLAGRWSITDASDRTERAGAKVFFARPVGQARSAILRATVGCFA